LPVLGFVQDLALDMGGNIAGNQGGTDLLRFERADLFVQGADRTRSALFSEGQLSAPGRWSSACSPSLRASMIALKPSSRAMASAAGIGCTLT
jgi:hypothetical protein